MFFGGKILDYSIWISVIFGFLMLGLISGINYIINDFIDIKSDRVHPEKANRPLASRAISVPLGIIFLIILIIIVVWGSFFGMQILSDRVIARRFSIMAAVIFVNGFAYNIFLKRHAFLDIISLSMIYIWRTMAGCFIASVEFSPWLYLMVFELALFLSINKRKADLEFLGDEEASKHKEVYEDYNRPLLKNMSSMITISLFLTYSFYCILGHLNSSGSELSNNRGLMVFTIPIALYLIFRYRYLVENKPDVARSAEKILKDPGLIIGAILIIITVYFANYFVVVVNI